MSPEELPTPVVSAFGGASNNASRNFSLGALLPEQMHNRAGKLGNFRRRGAFPETTGYGSLSKNGFSLASETPSGGPVDEVNPPPVRCCLDDSWIGSRWRTNVLPSPRIADRYREGACCIRRLSLCGGWPIPGRPL